MAGTSPSAAGVSHRGLYSTLAGALAFGVLVWFVGPLHDAAGFALSGNTSGLRAQLRDLGAWGVVVLLVIVLAHSVIPYPAEIPTAAAGFVYGFAVALPMMLAAWLLSAFVTFAIGHFAARPLLYRLVGERRFRRVERAVLRGGAPVLLAARLVPVVPFSLTGYVAGAAGVAPFRFGWTTVVGFIPITVVSVLLGSRLDSISLSDPVLYLALAPIVALLLAARPLARKLGEHGEDEPVGRDEPVTP